MKLSTPLTFLPLVPTLTARVVLARSQSNACSSVRYPPPSVRPPPEGGYQGHNFAAWTPPPPEHLYGTYLVTHTSFDESIPSVVNPRSERYPIYPSNEEFPAGSESEVDSWSTCDDPNTTDCKDPDAITTIFGHNVPIGAQGPTDKKYTAAWRYNATGKLEGSSNLRAIVAWGQDHVGSDYFAQYVGSDADVDDVEGGINIASRSEKGLSPVTYICLTSSLKQLAEELGDTELSEIVSRIRPLRDDHRRDGEGPVECDDSCVDNKNAPALDDEAQQLQRRNKGETQCPLNVVKTRNHFYPLGYRRGHTLPWWGWMTMGLVFGLPLMGGLCIAVPIALCKGHRRRQQVRAQRAAQGPTRDRQSSSVMEPEMIQTA